MNEIVEYYDYDYNLDIPRINSLSEKTYEMILDKAIKKFLSGFDQGEVASNLYKNYFITKDLVLVITEIALEKAKEFVKMFEQISG